MEDGFAVVFTDTAENGISEEELRVFHGMGHSCIYLKCDITSAEDRKKALDETAARYGRLDVLVNNAGVAPKVRADILDMTEDSMDRVLGVNLKGTFFMTQAAAKYMAGEAVSGTGIKPVIVNISSVSAEYSSLTRGEYCISKAGVSMITTLFAHRLAEYGINVYEVRPGIILTDMTSKVKERYDALISEGLVPFKRWGYPEDVADAVSLLCSGGLSFSTGDIINVDGGFHIKRL
jgi:NAD(P)-dependent dehydrogenase (short-subunit alcohol dehydrogenase family)